MRTTGLLATLRTLRSKHENRNRCSQSLKKPRTGIGNYIHGVVRLVRRSALNTTTYFMYANREIDLGFSGKRVSEQTDRAFGWCPGSLWLRGREEA